MSLRPSRSDLVLAVILSLAPRGPSAAQSSADAEQRFSTGIMHLREGRTDLALDELKKAVKEDPKSPYFQKGLGLAYAAKREWKDAIACFRKALELNPYYVDVRNDLGAALIGSGDREAGKNEFLAAYSDPTNPTPEISARNLGAAYLEEKNLAEAANWFRTSVARNKAYPAAYTGLAEALFATGRLEEAIAQLQQGVQEVPGDPDLLARARAGVREGRALRRGAHAPRGGDAEGPRRGGRPHRRRAAQDAAEVDRCPTAESSKTCSLAFRARAPPSSSTSRARSWSARASSTSATA